jgi:phosphatidylglycerophosphate synthase
MRDKMPIEEIRARSYKPRDAWWTVFLVDPLAARLVQVAVRFPAITPNRLTLGAFALGMGAAACFAGATYPWLVAGALLFHLSFVLDCMDGKIARLTGTGSVFGSWLDYVFDRLRVLVCAIALFGGQYRRTGEVVFLLVGGLVIFLDMFRYLNALQINKVKDDMRYQLAQVSAEGGVRPAFVEELVHEMPAGEADADALAGADGPVVDVHHDFRSRFAAFVTFRNFLVRHRVRAHVVSGIEFQMAVFIVGPLVGALVWVTLVAGALLLAFELLLIYKLYLSTKAFTRQLDSVERDAPATGPEPKLTPSPA